MREREEREGRGRGGGGIRNGKDEHRDIMAINKTLLPLSHHTKMSTNT